MELHKKFSPWVFVSINNDEYSHIRAWIHRRARAEVGDKVLAIKCEQMIESAFKRSNLKYFSKNSEKIVMEEMILSLEKDGIYVPEEFFIDPPESLKRVEMPSKYSTNES